MKVLHGIEIAILVVHQPIEGITGAMGIRKLIGSLKLWRFGFEFVNALSYAHLTELLETLDILTDTEFVTQLRQSMIQAEQGNTISWESAKAQLGI